MRKKVALVTGSSRGIGKEIARELIEQNFIVYITGRNKKNLLLAADDLGENIRVINEDFTDDEVIKKSIQSIIVSEKRLDLVVANLGSGKSTSGHDIGIEEYKRVFEINFFSAVSLAHESVKAMQNIGGNIVFIASIAGCETLGAPIAYSSAKTALLAFSKNLSNEVAKLNIRVNSISPGNVLFEGSTWDEKLQKDKEVVSKYIKDNVALNSFATPKDIANAVVFLQESNFITGTNIVVDGGQLQKII